MKKLFTIGLFALALSVSAEAKGVVKLKSTTKSKEVKKHKLLLSNFPDCQAGMTTCGTTYMDCGLSNTDPGDYWQTVDFFDCELGLRILLDGF